MEQIRRRDNNRTRRKIITGSALCALGLFVLLIPGVRAPFSRTVYMVAPSVWEWGDGIGKAVSLFVATTKERQVLIFENEALKGDFARMEALVLDRNLLEERVAILEESLGRKGNDNRILAKVLWVPGRTPYDTFVVDVGSEQEVSLGDLVVYAGAGVVGEVMEVYERSAKIKLYSFPGETREVLVGEAEIPGTAVGRGMGNFEVKIPRDSLVLSGDWVFLPPHTTGQDKFILGTVGFVEKKPEESFDHILFRAPFNTAEIQTVEVLRTTK
ncbi:MAG: rod shape-determining protein MreC [Patescibacteria group bacterium]